MNHTAELAALRCPGWQPTPRAVGLGRHGLTPLGAAIAVLLPLSAHSQVWNTQAALQMSMTATDNGALVADEVKQRDLITTLRPQIRIARRGANFGLSAELSADLVNYANNSEPDRVLPAAHVTADATLVERLVYLDASADVRQIQSNPYRGLLDAAPSGNTDTTSSVRISPYIDYQISPRVSLVARANESLFTSTQDAAPDRRSNQVFVRLSQKPLPFGAAVEVSRQATEYSGNTVNTNAEDLTSLAARVSVSYTFDGQFLVGGIAGRERNEFRSTTQSDNIVGVQFQWVPGPRTDLRARVEDRFFGTGWDVAFRHRTPFMSFSLGFNREPVGFSRISATSADTDLNQYLDAILTTRFPDPADRQAQVDDLVSSRNLRTRIPDAVDVLSGYAQLRSKANATLVWLGARNTFAVSAYGQTLRRLTTTDQPSSSPADIQSDNRQIGASVEFTRRLTPQIAVGAVAQWAKVDGLAAREGDNSRERSLRVSLSRNLSPRSSVAVGVERRELQTSVAAFRSYDVNTAFAALSYRF